MRVRYTIPALADLDEILDYVSKHSPRGSARVLSRIRTFVDLLPLHPLIGGRTDDPILRRLVVAPYPYLIFYEVGRNEIIIHAVRHSARNLSSSPGSGTS